MNLGTNHTTANELNLLPGDAAWLSPSVLEQYNKTRPLGPQELLCHAPFKSIYFGHHGKAIACCYNRTYILGEYPKRSIKEIWFGAEADTLRQYIKHNNLTNGCMGCHGQLIAGNFDAVKTKQYDELAFNANAYPSVMEFELSNVCNLECVMCSGFFSSLIRRKRENLPEIPMYYDAAFIDQLEEFIPYLQEVKFYGGEPFLIDYYYNIWDRIIAINPKVRISIQTNATTYNKRVEGILEKANVHINISLDSLQKETYESIRVNAKFERVMENIRAFHAYCKERNTFFGISACMMRNNWQEAPDFINFCNNMNVPVYFHTVFHPKDLALVSLPADELENIASVLSAHDFSDKTPVQKKNKRHYEDLINQINGWVRSAGDQTKVALNINSVAALESFLLNRLTHKVSDEQELETKKARLKTQLQMIIQKVDADTLSKSLQSVNLYDPNHDIDNMLRNILNLPIEELAEIITASARRVDTEK
jgi:MoaA/NifB/PqqE/SkfB family radical SAM enzyme